MLIKFAIRRNLIYPLLLIIFNFIRQMLTILIGRKFDFKNSLTYAPFMFLGEFLGGLILNLIQKKFIKKE